MALFYIQDTDRPMYVIANNFGNAVDKWESFIRKENEMDDDEYLEPPQGCQYICDNDMLIK